MTTQWVVIRALQKKNKTKKKKKTQNKKQNKQTNEQNKTKNKKQKQKQTNKQKNPQYFCFSLLQYCSISLPYGITHDQPLTFQSRPDYCIFWLN